LFKTHLLVKCIPYAILTKKITQILAEGTDVLFV